MHASDLLFEENPRKFVSLPMINCQKPVSYGCKNAPNTNFKTETEVKQKLTTFNKELAAVLSFA